MPQKHTNTIGQVYWRHLYIYSLTFWVEIMVPHCGEVVFKQLKQNLKLVTVPHCGEQDSIQFLAKLKVDHSSPFWGTIITVLWTLLESVLPNKIV